MHITSTNFAKTLAWKCEYDVKLWRHKQRRTNTNDHNMPLNEPLSHENFLHTTLKRGIPQIVRPCGSVYLSKRRCVVCSNLTCYQRPVPLQVSMLMTLFGLLHFFSYLSILSDAPTTHHCITRHPSAKNIYRYASCYCLMLTGIFSNATSSSL